MDHLFYQAFEGRFRGSSKLIKSRLAVYLPFLEPLKMLDDAPQALDLGCGRGEWLELLQDRGFKAKGVDFDEGMLLACQQRQLDVVKDDALAYLQGVATASVSVVSAFHVIEHISFDVLYQLVSEALRVLKPGGLLILETPNSENLLVASSSFYLDPSHQRPLPSDLVAFLAEYNGFARVKTLFLQEPPDVLASEQTNLSMVLEGVSSDYAVVAQKKAGPKAAALFDLPFEREYGVRLMTLVERYDQENQSQKEALQAASQQIAQLHQQVDYLKKQLGVESKPVTYVVDDSAYYESAHYWWVMADGYSKELQGIYSSLFWRAIQPLHKVAQLGNRVRKLFTAGIGVARRILRGIKHKSRLVIIGIIRKMLAYTPLKAFLSSMFANSPHLKQRLKFIIGKINATHRGKNVEVSIKGISSRAMHIYNRLQQDVKQKEI